MTTALELSAAYAENMDEYRGSRLGVKKPTQIFFQIIVPSLARLIVGERFLLPPLSPKGYHPLPALNTVLLLEPGFL